MKYLALPTPEFEQFASAKNKPIDAIISWKLNERRWDGCYSKCKFKFKLSQKIVLDTSSI